MKKILVILIAIFLLTGCTKGIELEGTAYYAFGKYANNEELKNDSKPEYEKVIRKNESNVIVKLENEVLSVCIFKDDKLECFKNTDFENDSKHLQEVFGNELCNLDSSDSENVVSCFNGNFYCSIANDSEITLKCQENRNGYSACYLLEDGSVDCMQLN